MNRVTPVHTDSLRMTLLRFRISCFGGYGPRQGSLGKLPFLRPTQGQIGAAAHRLSGESETLVVSGVYLRSSGLTSLLVLDMPCAAS